MCEARIALFDEQQSFNDLVFSPEHYICTTWFAQLSSCRQTDEHVSGVVAAIYSREKITKCSCSGSILLSLVREKCQHTRAGNVSLQHVRATFYCVCTYIVLDFVLLIGSQNPRSRLKSRCSNRC